MNIESEDLRARIASLSTDELKAIIDSPEDAFLPLARELAAAELARRGEPYTRAPIPGGGEQRPTQLRDRHFSGFIYLALAWLIAFEVARLLAAAPPRSVNELTGIALLAAGFVLLIGIGISRSSEWPRILGFTAAGFGILGIAECGVRILRSQWTLRSPQAAGELASSGVSLIVAAALLLRWWFLRRSATRLRQD